MPDIGVVISSLKTIALDSAQILHDPDRDTESLACP